MIPPQWWIDLRNALRHYTRVRCFKFAIDAERAEREWRKAENIKNRRRFIAAALKGEKE